MKMPPKTAVAAIAPDGQRIVYPTIHRCSEEGGFDYSSVRNCLHGRQKTHAGFTFEALSPLRQRKQNTSIAKVARLRNKGLSNPEIAKVMGLKPSTVPYYASQATNMGLCKTWHQTQEDLAFAKSPCP